MWQLALLGGARLYGPAGSVRLERRTAAVLAYLALEGETVKYRLAGWLWADSPETTARNNMRQLLRRLRSSAGRDLIEGEDRIRLAADLEVDAAQMQAFAFSSDARALDFRGDLLEGLEFDDCPEFEEWLHGTRAGLVASHRSVASAESERFEQSGELTLALRFANLCVNLEALSEEAHRRVMRLHYLLGDRAAALAAFEQCRDVLRRELDVEPLPETLALAQEIERGTVLPSLPRQVRAVPLAVLHPPVLAGRDREWARLEAAWASGQFIAISGAPGTGKTRLMLDFVGSKVPRESILYLQSRPGDAAVPYSSHARNWRLMLEQFRPTLEPWVRDELARIVPELGDSPGPIRSEAEKLRFYQAKLESMMAVVRAGLRVLVSDDVQFTDPASAEASLYLMGAFASTGIELGAVYAFRHDELSASVAEVLQQGSDAGLIADVHLEPLGLEAIGALLAGLKLNGAQDLAAPLQRYTGGNPLFVLETLRHLQETGQLERGWPGRLPPPGKVGPLVQRRLERLSKSAQNFAQAAAVLESDFDLELLCDVLGVSPFEAAPVWAELEGAQVMAGERFSHDLVFEGVRAGIPVAVRRWLHRRAAGALEGRRTDPARIASHWLEGGEGSRAAPWLIRAAERAQAAYRFADAAQFLEVAAREFEASAQRSEAFNTLDTLARLLPRLKSIERFEQTTDSLSRLASGKLEEARAWHARALMFAASGRYEDSETAARNGLERIVPNVTPELELLLHEALGTALRYRGH